METYMQETFCSREGKKLAIFVILQQHINNIHIRRYIKNGSSVIRIIHMQMITIYFNSSWFEYNSHWQATQKWARTKRFQFHGVCVCVCTCHTSAQPVTAIQMNTIQTIYFISTPEIMNNSNKYYFCLFVCLFFFFVITFIVHLLFT